MSVSPSIYPYHRATNVKSHFLASVGACNLIVHIHIVVNWQLSKQGICWPVSHDRITGSGVDPSSLHAFLKLSADKLLIFKWSQAQVKFFFNAQAISCVHKPCYLSFDFKLTLDSKIQLVFTGREGSCFWLFSLWSLVGYALHPIFISDWSKFDRWIHVKNLCCIWKLVYW